MNIENTTNGNSKDGDNYNMKNNKKEALIWILKYNRTPFPYSPVNAAKKDCEPKQPGYFDGNYFKQLKWKNYQYWEQLTEDVQQELIKAWHGDERIEGIGCNAGWNGEFYFSMIDFDLKNFDSLEAMNQAIEGWENRNPELLMVPRSRTQSGGYRYYVGFESVSKNWGNTISFTFTQGGEKSLGELMVGPGGLGIILGKGLKGNYSWDRNPCGEIPVFPNPESIGLYQAEKAIATSTPIASIYDTTDTPELAREALSYIPVYEDYQTWINIGMACHAAKLDFEDWDNWSQGGKNYTNSNDTSNHWKSFKEKPGGIQAGTLFHYAKQHGWKQPRRNYDYQNSLRNSSKSDYQTSGTAVLKHETQSNVVPLHSKKTDNLPPIKDEINKLFDKNLTQSELEDAVQSIAQIYNRQPNNVWRLYYKKSEEIEKQYDKNNQKTNLDKLLRLSQRTLNLSDYLHQNLATPLKNVASWMGTSQEAILTTLLPVSASLIHLDTRLELIGATNFYANPIIYSGIVAESGSLKSPTQKLLTNPLAKLQELADKDYELLMMDYQEEMIDYKASLKDNNNQPPLPIPTPPKQREYFVIDVTSEAVAGVQANQPDRGFLGFQDELKALISSQNAYRGGRGSDAEKLLSGRDGSGIKVNRAGGKRLFCKRSGYSLTGGIQPDVLKKLMGDFDDPNGFWARFIWCILPVAPSQYPENTASFDIDNLLLDVYKKMENEKPQTHKLSTEAKEIYKDWYNHLDDLKLKEIRQGLRAVYSKMKGVTGEFALILHRLNSAVDGCQPDEYISKDVMAKAIELAKFYITQIKLIHADGEAEQGEIAPQLKKLYEFALTQGTWLSASDIKKGCRLFKKSMPEDIRQAFLDLVEFGYGSVEGEGKSLKYCADIQKLTVDAQKLTKVDRVSIPPIVPQIIDSIGLQEIKPNTEVDKVDKKLTLCQPTQTIDSIGLQPINDAKVDKLTHNTTDKNIIPNQLDENTDLLTERQLCQLSPSNPDIITVDGVSTSVNSASTLSTFGERSPEPETEPLDFDHIKEGDILFDGNGQPHKITGRTRQLWETHRKQYISRNDITTGQFHRATVEDVTKLIKRTIKGKNKIQAQWLCSVYGGNGDSLMALAIDTNPEELALIFDFDGW